VSSKRLVSDVVASLPAYQAGRTIEEVSRDFGVTDVIKLASNENPFGPSPMAVAAMANALNSANRYPEDAAVELRAELARRHGVHPNQVVLGAGGTDLIELSVRTFTTPAEHALVSAGSFVAYKLFLMAASVPFTEVPLVDDAIDLPGIARAVRPETKLIFLPNPNNPTGTRFTAGEFDRFAAAVPEQVVLVLDDAYLDFCEPGDDMPNSIALMRKRSRTLVLRSFSKAYGLAGMRLGYGLGAPELVEYLLKVRRPFAVNRVAIEGGRAALDDVEHLERTLVLTRMGRAFLYEQLSSMGLRAVKSYANFVMVDLGTELKVARLARALLERGLIVRPLAPFGLPHCLRFSVGTERENRKLVQALLELKEV
jgi:histidinol-phosphate aminotransferase